MKDLRKLNFGKVIQLAQEDVSDYTFAKYRENGFSHPKIIGYCLACEEKNIETCPKQPEYKLTNISHGALSSDFFLSTNIAQDMSKWHSEPIMFVYETPSLDYGIYHEVAFKGHNKRPPKEWYWIHGNHLIEEYPERFRGGVYGDFVLSAIQTFKLKTVYMTNLVKCGMNNSEGKFLGLGSFNEKTIENCFFEVLSKEIELLKPKVIFAVGSAVEGWLNHFLKGNQVVQQLPHPAGRRRGFRDDHYKALYFWGVARALHKAKIIDTNEGSNLARIYLEKYEK